MGAESYLVDKPDQLEKVVANACKRADEQRKPQVIVVKIDPSERPPYGNRNEALKQGMGVN